MIIENQQKRIETLEAEVADLKAGLNGNSRNSYRPPSSDGFNKPKPAFKKKKKRRGGQAGHRGKTLKRVAAPDVVGDCEPAGCFCAAPRGETGYEVAISIHS